VLTYLARRLALMLVSVFGVTVLTFMLARVVPSDPARLIAGPRASLATVQHVGHLYGLDRPAYQQYYYYLRDVAHGDLGTSFMDHRPVLDDIRTYLPATLELSFYAILFGAALGVFVGYLSARWNGRVIGGLLRTSAIMSVAVATFWLAILLQIVFYTRLGTLPFGGRLATGMAPPPSVTGFYTVDALLAGQWSVLQSALEHLVLPATALGIAIFGIVARLMRASALEVLNADYVRTARSKGLTPGRIACRHVIRTASLPVVTLVALQVGYIASGAVLVESIFAWPGLGRYTFDAIAATDYNAIMGVTLVSAVLYLALNFAVDLAYLVIDPRIRYW
jgi:peptide/nickel transport system permease protein